MTVTVVTASDIHLRYARFISGGWRAIMNNLAREGFQPVRVLRDAPAAHAAFARLAGLPGDPWLPAAAFGRPAGLANARQGVRRTARVYLLGFTAAPREAPR